MSLCRHLGSKLWARILACLVFGGALLAYKATLHPGFFPGESARQVAVALLRAPNTLDVRSAVSTRKAAPLVLDRRRQVRVDEAAQDALPDAAMLQERRMTLRTRFRLWSLCSSLPSERFPRA